ncbi:MAG TPA: hypothetical protein VJR89_14495 [Polyangiales bacterium]|nr:hypothetical protein [Polyangiales bacterium]
MRAKLCQRGGVMLLIGCIACSSSDPTESSGNTGTFSAAHGGSTSSASGGAGSGGSNVHSPDAGGAIMPDAPAGKGDCAPPSFPQTSRTCRADRDCTTGASCAPELPPAPQCGSPCPGCVTNRCTTDADCVHGVCEPSKEFPGLSIQHCAPHCRDTGCAPGDRCASDGRCKPVRCTDGFSCGEHMRCSAGSASADAHGCEPIPCDEAGGAACAAPAVCTRAQPRTPVTPSGCALVPCADPRHPGCEPNMRCQPELELEGSYGCARMKCQRDADCDCGACIVRTGSEGYCYDHVGICVPQGTLNCPP